MCTVDSRYIGVFLGLDVVDVTMYYNQNNGSLLFGEKSYKIVQEAGGEAYVGCSIYIYGHSPVV